MRFLYNQQLLKWLVLLAMMLLIVSFISFWFGQPSFSDSSVVLKIEGPSQASVGDEVRYKMILANEARADLKDIKLKFIYPEDSVVIENGAISENLEKEADIDELASGQRKEFEFSAFLVGDKGNIKTAKAELFFRPGDLRTQFEKSTSLSTTIISLPVSLTLVAPPNAVSGQPVNYILDYRNESGNDLTDLLMEFSYPNGFSFQRATPSPSGGNNSWPLSLLKKDAGGRISIQGIISGKEGESKKLSVALKRKIADKYVPYEKAEVSTSIANPLLGVEISVNGSPDYSAFPGDDLLYTIKYSNNSNFNLSGLNLTVRLEGQMYDISTLDTKGGFFDGQNRTITWNSGAISDLGNLMANRRGQAEFKIKLKTDSSSAISGSNNSFVRATATLSTPNVPSGVGGDEISAQGSITTRITTQPTFRQIIYYNDPAFGSTGPLPPEVGKETSFTVHWQLTNPGNDMTNARLSGVLPVGVEWENVTGVTAGQPEVIFNRSTSEVVWNLSTLPGGVGVNRDKYEASFRIKIKPSVTQKGSAVTLIKNSKMTATDSFTKQNIILPLGDMTTIDLYDRPGEGTVQ